MLCQKVIAVFQSHIKHINALCGQNVVFFAFNLMTDKETNRPAGFNKIIMLSNVAELVQRSL